MRQRTKTLKKGEQPRNTSGQIRVVVSERTEKLGRREDRFRFVDLPCQM